VVGRHRFALPYAVMPYTEIVDDEQYIMAAFNLGYGAVAIENIRLGEAVISTFTDAKATKAWTPSHGAGMADAPIAIALLVPMLTRLVLGSTVVVSVAVLIVGGWRGAMNGLTGNSRTKGLGGRGSTPRSES
jgi:hypothetical protein